MGQSMSQLGQGVGGIVGSVGDFIGAQYDAAMKEMEADQERMRASRDALKSINDSLSELIQKSISTQDAIQQNMNQVPLHGFWDRRSYGYQRHFHATGFGNFPQCGRIRQRGRVDRERVERHQRGGEQGHHACGAHGDGTGQPGLHLWLHAVPRP